MATTIVQKVVFKNTTPNVLYALYMDAKKHSLVTGDSAKITTKVGAKFSAFGDYITGKNIHLVKDKLIVQTWRGIDWGKNDADSIFIIQLEPKGKDVVLHAVHANLPDKHAGHIDKGWHDYYWNPWKDHLAGRSIRNKPKM